MDRICTNKSNIKKRLIKWSSLLAGLVAAIASINITYSETIIGDPVMGTNDPILGSKHDFSGLNKRAGVVAMPSVAFSDYGNPCIYCHVPPDKADADADDKGAIPGWNRFEPATDRFRLYDSMYLDSKTRTPSPISLLCLSCHDGTMAVDMVVFKPGNFDAAEDAAFHMRINGEDNTVSCGKCHNGRVAHDISIKHLDTDLKNDHPISMRYAGLLRSDIDFRKPHTPGGFDNGVRLYEGRVECASCHNVHNPEK
ncbi:MAG: hypothetical protein OEX00_11440, partial [Gammaproteobacteria bacterium]|nr:hypothetical protein [Gammaproteobacteria bacterium]